MSRVRRGEVGRSVGGELDVRPAAARVMAAAVAARRAGAEPSCSNRGRLQQLLQTGGPGRRKHAGMAWRGCGACAACMRA